MKIETNIYLKIRKCYSIILFISSNNPFWMLTIQIIFTMILRISIVDINYAQIDHKKINVKLKDYLISDSRKHLNTLTHFYKNRDRINKEKIMDFFENVENCNFNRFDFIS